ncbi:MAG: hypothetical protein MUC60_09555 [Oscillatoria sp. Prado101]|nr:hypothetical protein [Oscillatoria sp. Prado101]
MPQLRPCLPGCFGTQQTPLTGRAATSSGQILFAGGQNHKTGHETDTEACYQRWEEYLRARYEVESFTCKWLAQFYEPRSAFDWQAAL